MKVFIAALLAGVCVAGVSFAGSSSPAQQVFSGEISDTQCVFNVHSHNSSHDDMIKTHAMGDTAAECARTCIKRGGKYVLIDTVNKKIYPLASSALPLAEKFAGQEVRIRGVYDKDANLLYIAEIKAH